VVKLQQLKQKLPANAMLVALLKRNMPQLLEELLLLMVFLAQIRRIAILSRQFQGLVKI
jgi:hypothetical protein